MFTVLNVNVTSSALIYKDDLTTLFSVATVDKLWSHGYRLHTAERRSRICILCVYYFNSLHLFMFKTNFPLRAQYSFSTSASETAQRAAKREFKNRSAALVFLVDQNIYYGIYQSFSDCASADN